MFDRLLGDIVSGRYPAGARLPAERELAPLLGASRPTLREALRRLGEWNLVKPRRGSGVVVRPKPDWSLEVLPAYLRLAAAADGPGALVAIVADLLALRRSFFLDIVARAGRLSPTALAQARAAAHRAFAARSVLAVYVREDFEVLRTLADAARLLPTRWLMNGLAGVYFALVETFAPAVQNLTLPPDDYLRTYERVLSALERNDAVKARGILERYLDEHDRRLLAFLQRRRRP